MAIVKVACPSCGKRYEVPEEQLQREAVCKACGHEFAVSEAQLEEERETTSSGQPQWHVEINGARSGPFEREKVLALFESSEITRNSLVWRQGMEDWQPLKSVSEFASEIPQIVPPSAQAPSGQETEGVAAPSLPRAVSPRRPAGLVFVVFYTALSGLSCTIYGGLTLVSLLVLEGMMGAIGDVPDKLRGLGRVGLVLGEFAAFLLFFLGVFALVCAYGLWCQQWGLRLARILYAIFAVLALIALVLSIATGAGVLPTVVELCVSVSIFVYLSGSAELTRMARGYLRRLEKVEE